jgi:beta-glucosidase
MTELFWWGVSTAPFQTEESPTEPPAFRTDWDLAADRGTLRHRRGAATRSFSSIERDVAALLQLGVSHYRMGVEWARLEPRPGVYDAAALAVYRRQLTALRAAGIQPILTLWHFAFPDWLTDLDDASRHGWLHPDCALRWQAFVRHVVGGLGDLAHGFAPQNEPNTQNALGFVAGIWPPHARLSLTLYRRNEAAAARAYVEAAGIVRALAPHAFVVTVQNVVAWKRFALDWTGAMLRVGDRYNFGHLDAGVAAASDMIGFNYYFEETAWPLAGALQAWRRRAPYTDMGWTVAPDGLRRLALALAERYRKPLVVMENGIATTDEARRGAFLEAHVEALRRAAMAGADVRGYFHWTLCDNFEWAEGYRPRFGLFAYDAAANAFVAKPAVAAYRALTAAQRL